MKQLKSQDIKIVMGDLNLKVGSERTENIIRPFGIGHKNERGYRLVEFYKQHSFTVMNIRNHLRRCWTWKSPGDRPRNQIDLIILQELFYHDW